MRIGTVAALVVAIFIIAVLGAFWVRSAGRNVLIFPLTSPTPIPTIVPTEILTPTFFPTPTLPVSPTLASGSATPPPVTLTISWPHWYGSTGIFRYSATGK